MLARLTALAFALPLLAVACGGNTPPPEVPKTTEQNKPAEQAAHKKPLVEHRRDFMEGCNAKVPNAPDYCECGWEQMQKVFSEDEMNASGEADKGKLAQLKDLVE